MTKSISLRRACIQVLLVCFSTIFLQSQLVNAQEINCDSPETVLPKSSSQKKKHGKQSKVNRAAVERAATLVKEAYPAQVLAVSGSVLLVSREGEALSNSQKLTANAPLYLNDVIETSPKSFMSLKFGDGSVNVLPPNAKIQLKQVSKAIPRVVLLKGRIESRITKAPNAKKNTFEIQLPTVSIGVRGTRFRVELDSSEVARVAVEDGVVKITQRNVCVAPLTLQAGQAAYVNSATPVARNIIAAPEMLETERAQRDIDRMVFKLKPVDGAKGYHMQLAKDADFTDIRQEVYSDTINLVFNNDDLPDGFYFARVSAIDNIGIEGYTNEHIFLKNSHAEDSEGITFVRRKR